MTQQKAEIKHTPGPWTIGRDCLPGGPSFMAIHSSDRAATAICSMRVNVPEVAANARLIAAAPDLLAALQAFYKWWGSIDCICLNPEPIPNALGEQMEAAIAKATNPNP